MYQHIGIQLDLHVIQSRPTSARVTPLFTVADLARHTSKQHAMSIGDILQQEMELAQLHFSEVSLGQGTLFRHSVEQLTPVARLGSWKVSSRYESCVSHGVYPHRRWAHYFNLLFSSPCHNALIRNMNMW